MNKFKSYIAIIMAFLFPVVRNAVAQTAADEIGKWASKEQRRLRERERDIRRRRSNLVSDFEKYQPPYPMRRATERVGYSRIPAGGLPHEILFDGEDIEKQLFHDVLMVAFDLTGPSAQIAQEWLMERLPQVGEHGAVDLDSWWVANDERYDGSDCDSAVFVPMGKQHEARELLRKHGITSL